MADSTTATLNYQLTNYAQGFWNDLKDVVSLAERLAPTTPVPGASGQFKKFSDKNSFLPYDTARAMGGDPNVMKVIATDDTYSCKPQALETRVDKTQTQQAGDAAIGIFDPDEAAVRTLLNGAALSHVKQVCDYVLANTTAVADRGNWSNVDIDPIDQLNEQLLALAKTVGSTQNMKLTLDLGAMNSLYSHPKVKARANGVQLPSVTAAQLSSLLIVPVDVFVGNVVYDTTGIGVTASKSRLLSSVALLHYSMPNASVYDPSPFKTFTVGAAGPVAGVRSYQAPNGLWTGHIIDWSRDIKQTSTASMIRLNIA